jgi:hypothetical protein
LFLAVLTALSTVVTLLGLRFLSLHEHVGIDGAIHDWERRGTCHFDPCLRRLTGRVHLLRVLSARRSENFHELTVRT